MESQWIEAGFFVISDGRSPEREPRLLPPRLVTVSTCIAEVYPDVPLLAGTNTPARLLDRMRKALRLDTSDFARLRSWVANALEHEEMGWPNVFYSLGAARKFKRLFLGTVGETRIVGLSLTRKVANDFIQEEGYTAECGEYGVCKMLMKMAVLRPGLSPLGFDVLGAENDGMFHTFSCNSIEGDLNERLGISFNDFGLIDHYEAAAAACEYMNRRDVPTEPVHWYPFRVDEYEEDEVS